MARLAFDDGTPAVITMADDGLRTSRFNNWIPDPEMMGEKAHNVYGIRWQFPMGEQHRVSFEMPRIPTTQEDLIQRLILHTDGGGIFEIITDDAEDNQYDNCQMAPGAKIGIRRDPELMELTLSIHALNRDGTPFRCVY